VTKQTLLALLLVVLVTPIGAQDTAAQLRAGFEARIEQRLRSNVAMRLAADSITLTGETLSLSGNVRIRFERIIVIADQATIDRAARRVTLGGNVNWNDYDADGRVRRLELR
jgi:lipopolysaccharide assembly outer membrane protein LptD (OstA)